MHWLVLGVHPAFGRHIHLQTTEIELARRRLKLIAEARAERIVAGERPPPQATPRVELRRVPDALMAWAPLPALRP